MRSAMPSVSQAPGSARTPGAQDRALRRVPGAGDLERLALEEQFAHRHLVAGQRPGLVGPDDRDRPQRLRGGQRTHDDAPPTEPAHADRQHRGRDQRQPRRNDRHDQADERVQQRRDRHPAEATRRDGGAADRQTPENQRLAELRKPLAQRGRSGGDLREQAGDPADLGAHPGRGDDRRPASPGDDRAREEHVGAIGERGALGQNERGVLADRERFAGERRLVREEPLRGVQSHVGRDPISRGEFRQVSRDQLARRDQERLAAPHDARRGRAQPGERRQGAVGAVFLEEAEKSVEEREKTDRDAIRPMRQVPRDRRRQQQRQQQRVGELAHQQRAGRRGARLTDDVAPVLAQPPARLGGREAARGVRAELMEDDLPIFSVPAIEHRRL